MALEPKSVGVAGFRPLVGTRLIETRTYASSATLQGDATNMSNLLRFVAVGLVTLGVASAVVLTLPTIGAAADPAFVGVLSLVVEPDVAKELGLSDEIKAKVLAVVDKREQEVVGLASDKEL